jgi:translation initiation factor IF-3
LKYYQDGYQLRFAIKLRGRENIFKDIGFAKLQKAVEWIGEQADHKE